MEKFKPHYFLVKLKKLFRDPKTRMVTDKAFSNAVSLGYTEVNRLIDVIEHLDNRNFYKAMTSYSDNKVWQDVYKVIDDQNNKIYLKLQLSMDRKKAILIQFKEDTGD